MLILLLIFYLFLFCWQVTRTQLSMKKLSICLSKNFKFFFIKHSSNYRVSYHNNLMFNSYLCFSQVQNIIKNKELFNHLLHLLHILPNANRIEIVYKAQIFYYVKYLFEILLNGHCLLIFAVCENSLYLHLLNLQLILV